MNIAFILIEKLTPASNVENKSRSRFFSLFKVDTKNHARETNLMGTLRPDTVKVCLSFAGIPKKLKSHVMGKLCNANCSLSHMNKVMIKF